MSERDKAELCISHTSAPVEALPLFATLLTPRREKTASFSRGQSNLGQRCFQNNFDLTCGFKFSLTSYNAIVGKWARKQHPICKLFSSPLTKLRINEVNRVNTYYGSLEIRSILYMYLGVSQE